MDGILLPVMGGLAGIFLCSFAMARPQYRRFAFPALIAPFFASVVLLLGSFILADMNPAREYGAAYIPTGKEHDPTTADYLLVWLSVIFTFFVTGLGGFLIQKYASKAIGRQRQAGQGNSDD